MTWIDEPEDPMPGYTPDPEWYCQRCEGNTREPITKKMICHDCRGWEQYEDECMKDFGKRIGAVVVKVDTVPDIEDNQ